MPPKSKPKSKKTSGTIKKIKKELKPPKEELTILENVINHARSFYPGTSSSKSGSTKIKKLLKPSKRDERLKKYHWGFGLEHEMHVFHEPILSKKKITDFIVFDSENAVYNLLNSYLHSKGKKPISVADKQYLEEVAKVFEWSGRRCDRKDVLKRVNVRMPEFVTDDPFSSLSTTKRPVEEYCDQLISRERRFLRILNKSRVVRRQEEVYGKITQYPMGTCSYIMQPLSSGPTAIHYKFKTKKNGKPETLTDYTGSYHITITLPFTKKTKEKKFVAMHQNFANMIQGIEPLMIVGFFSCDPRAMGTKLKRVRGSFRVVRTGWGNLAGSDVRKFNEGIGRYADIETYWREGLKFHNLWKLDYCKNVKMNEPGAVSALSSNIRTFGSTDPARPWHRESGYPMNKPNGIELRIFDNFSSNYRSELCKFIVYIAENSRNHTAVDFVYKDQDWIQTVQEIMKHGWKAILPKGYLDKLRKNLGLSLQPKSLRASDVLHELNERLFLQNRNGDWSYLMLDHLYDKPPCIPNVNRKSWEMAFFVRLNREEHLLNKFNKFIYSLDSKLISFTEFKKKLFKLFDKKLWEPNADDIAYVMETHKLVKLTMKDGEIDKVKYLKPANWSYKDVNTELLTYWSDAMITAHLSNLLK